tara:strand:+ start:1552 stop:2604 length:1053 start_codon:yes stop_codon:yes gene_type:complete
MSEDVFPFDIERLTYEIQESLDNAQFIYQDDTLTPIPINEYSTLNESLLKASGLYWEDGSGLGKLIRPKLVHEATKSFKGNIDASYKVGASIQMIHNFSLVHDDIQDKSTTRRGRNTLWKDVGTAQAINIGDELFALSYEPLLRLMQSGIDYMNMYDLIKVIQTAIIKLTHGQYLDIKYENEDNIDLQSYIRMIEDKTGALFSAAMESSGILSNKNDSLESLAQYGSTLGMLFQAVDDYINIWSQESIDKEKISEDIYNKKKSLPFILTTNINEQIRDDIIELYKKEINENVIEDILGIFLENNIKEACQTFILETNTKANNVLVYDEYLEEDEVSEILNFKDTILERIK